MQQRRCLVPATAYSEPRGRSPAVYWWFGIAPDGSTVRPFTFAGIWCETKDPQGGGSPQRETFAIATTRPNGVAGRIHNRMPVILRPEDHETWLLADPLEAASLLRPIADERTIVIGHGAGLKTEPARPA